MKGRGAGVIAALIGESGRVVHVETLQSPPELDGPARKCIEETVYEPAMRGGKPIASIVLITVSAR